MSTDMTNLRSNTAILKPLALPLRGPALIEASAGTGKTYTLAMLYLRLVLNHGGDAAFGETMLPHNILVVTFTKAATRELRDRIRQRLVEAAAYLRALAEPEMAVAMDVDDLLRDLCASYKQSAEQAGAAKRLEMAAEAMDEAAISTIHAWCYRVLSEFALHYGGGFEQSLLESETELLKETSEDFWRLCVMGMGREALFYMMQRFAGPEKLLDEVKNLLAHRDNLPEANADLEAHIAQQETQKQALITQVKADLAGSVDTLEAYFAEAEEAGLYKSLAAGHKAGALAKIRDYIDSQDSKLEANKSLEKLAMLDLSIWKDQAQAQTDLPAAKHLAKALSLAEELPSPDAYILTFACHWISQRLDSKKQQQGLLSNDDLLLRLQQALQGKGGEQLAAAIRQRFPMAMVDEFQDTDPVQYDIFNRVYGIRDGCPDAGFIMIGDPKQAIYAFRGGDIYTYLQAREHTTGHHHTLPHNFRSDEELINSVNGLFSHGDSHAYGAFRFRRDEQNPLPFLPVSAGRKAKRKLVIQGQEQSSQVAWVGEKNEKDEKVGKAMSDTLYVKQMSDATANEIARLLNLSAQDEAHIADGDDQQVLEPKHMAILVANQKQASAVREALAKRQIPSVYLSDSSSVYTTPIAQDVLLLLRAVADPDDDRLLSMALPTLLVGLDVATMDTLQRDELAWEKQLQRFHTYHQIWQSKGVLALLYQVIFDSHAAARILANPGGERLLTDLLHLAELLQQAAVNLDGEHSLVRHFENLLDNPDKQDANQQQRLESDSNLVQVVTIHKSKGLEYPVVFLPFVSKTRVAKASDMPLIHHDSQRRKQVTLEADKSILKMVEQERQTEEIRKLYVALTRASCCQYLGLGDIKNADTSGIGCLLMLPETPGQLADYLHGLGDSLQLQSLPADAQWQHKRQQTDTWQGARQAPAVQVRNWYTASYSALSFSSHKPPAQIPAQESDNAPDTAQEAILLEEQQTKLSSELQAAAAIADESPSMHNLPKGALYGTMLHEMLEDCAAMGFTEVVANQAARQKIINDHLQPLNLENWAVAIDDWLTRFIAMPWQLGALASSPLRLHDVDADQMLVEMEFLLSTHEVDVVAMDKLVCQHTWQQQERPQADAQQLHGMLKGYIDLLIEHQGQYFVVDWKSNYLGEDASAYSHGALRDALLHKRYDMQYILYILALHRLLKSRLHNYDYDLHVGGAVYVFLRGCDNSETQGLLMDKPPRQLIEGLHRLFQGDSGGLV